MGRFFAGASGHLTEYASDAAQGMVLPRHGSLSFVGATGQRRLHYCDWGNPDNARVVVCLHGPGRSARDFDALARELSTDYRVICPDLPGRGEADWLGRATVHDFAQILADADALLSGLELGFVDLIGASTGADLAIRLAQRPATLVRCLYVMDTAAGPPALSSREISAITAMQRDSEPARSATQRSLRVDACSSASTSRSTRMGLVR